MENVTLGIAFVAGFLSFVSPCVLPLIPAYITYLSGRASRQVALEAAGVGGSLQAVSRLNVLMHGIAFVLGLGFVFVLFGLLTNAALLSVRQNSIAVKDFMAQFGGIIVIFFGLFTLGIPGWIIRQLLKVQWEALGTFGTTIKRGVVWLQTLLYSDTRAQMNPRAGNGYVGSMLMGVAFAAGWSPCIGPIYGAILTVAVNASSADATGQTLVFLSAYVLGLGVPFLLMALALDQLRGFMRKIQKQMRIVEIVSGVFLIILGVMLYSGTLVAIAQQGGGLAQFSYNLEACGTSLFSGEVPLSDFGKCLDLGPDYKYINAAVAP